MAPAEQIVYGVYGSDVGDLGVMSGMPWYSAGVDVHAVSGLRHPFKHTRKLTARHPYDRHPVYVQTTNYALDRRRTAHGTALLRCHSSASRNT